MAVVDLERDYLRCSDALKEREREIAARRKVLEGRAYESFELEALLRAATDHERANLAEILKESTGTSAGGLAAALNKAGSHLVGLLVRRGQGVGYHEVVRDVAAKLKLSKMPETSIIYERERQILIAAFNRRLAEATPQEREEVLADLARTQGGGALGLGAGAAAIAVANLSGFALYTAASTTLAAIAGSAGITLPFAAYTGLSSALATLTGPVGWLVLGIGAVAVAGGVNYKKTVPAVILVATVRTRLIAERDQEFKVLQEEQASLDREWVPLRRLRAFLDALGPVGAGHTVPSRSVPR